jgi:hypothetical protein
VSDQAPADTTTQEQRDAAAAREVAQNVRDRQERAIWRKVVIVGILATAVIWAFGWRLVAPRLESAKRMDRAQALVASTDTTLAKLDSAVNAVAAMPTTATADALDAMTPDLAATRTSLAESVTLLDEAMPRLTDEEQRQAALVQEGARGRIEALDAVAAISSAARRATGDPSASNLAALKAVASGPSSKYVEGAKKAADAVAAVKAL